MTTLTSDVTAIRYSLSLTTPGERNANDQMATHADQKSYAESGIAAGPPARVTHGEVGPAGDNSDPGASTADGADRRYGTVAIDEADGRRRAASAGA